MTTVLFIATFFFGMVHARIVTIAQRGGLAHTDAESILVKIISLINTLAALVWAFVYLDWYIPVGVFIAVSILAASLVNSDRWYRLFEVEAGFGVTAIILGVSLYTVHYI